MIIVLGSEKLSLVELEAFLAASGGVGFAGDSRTEIYRWSEALLCHQEYWTQKRPAKGLIRAYMERMTGLSRAQCARLIGQYRKTGRIAVDRSRRRKFPSRYTVADVALLARVDQAHERPGHAAHPEARVRGLRQGRVRAAGGDLQRPSVQPAGQPRLPPEGVPL